VLVAEPVFCGISFGEGEGEEGILAFAREMWSVVSVSVVCAVYAPSVSWYLGRVMVFVKVLVVVVELFVVMVVVGEPVWLLVPVVGFRWGGGKWKQERLVLGMEGQRRERKLVRDLLFE
jgi:hypothetical protein